MSFIGGLLGGGSGANFQAQSANIQAPTTANQAQIGYNNAQDALLQQQGFVNALNGQNGIQNQSDVYNQLQGVANGTGPNPAQAMLNQATGSNVANTAALIAGARGASSNPGLIARQAGNAGANVQQQAVGQGATMQANQSLGAINAAGNIAGQQVANRAAGVQSLNQNQQAEQGQLLGAIQGQNNAAVNMQSNMNSTNADIAKQNAAGQGNFLGNLAGGIAKGAMLLAHGGAVPGVANQPIPAHSHNVYADGGPVAAPSVTAPGMHASKVGQFMAGLIGPGAVSSNQTSPMSVAGANTGEAIAKGIGAVADLFKPAPTAMAGGPMDNAPMPMAPQQPMMAAKGGAVKKKPVNGEMLASKGKMVPGKAKVKGDSLKNDTVDAKLSPGEVVIPRSVMQSADPVGNAAKFVHAVLAKNSLKR